MTPPADRPMTYEEAVEYLYSMRLFGAKLGLANTRRLAELAGRPQGRLCFIHVAGTNGKGSVCACLEAVYRAAGYRVGLYTSPHLVTFRERMQVNRQPIAIPDLLRLIDEIRPLLAAFPEGGHPTFFEVTTVLALRYFAESGCEVVIWETGLGGRLDATNIVTPLASVITNVSLEHQKWLGNSVAEIAREKGGIIKPGVPAWSSVDQPEAREVLTELARERAAPLTFVGPGDIGNSSVAELPLAMPGEHQRLNATLAAAVISGLQGTLPVDIGTLRAGLSGARMAGRFQVVRRPGGRLLVLDGAHNPAGVRTLRDTLLREFPGREVALVLATLAEKDHREMCGLLAPLAARIAVAAVKSERTGNPADLAEACRSANPAAEVMVTTSAAAALEAFDAQPLVVVAGSLHFLGEAMEVLLRRGELDAHLNSVEPGSGGPAPGALPVIDERGLNDYSARP